MEEPVSQKQKPTIHADIYLHPDMYLVAFR